MGGDPVNRTDPTGEFGVGFFAGAGFEFMIQTVEKISGARTTGYDYRAIGLSGLAGATGVGAAKVIARASSLGKTGSALAQLGSDAVVSAGSQLAKDGNIDGINVAVDVIAGATLGKYASDRAAHAAAHSEEGRMLSREADRKTRIADGNPRESRLDAARRAQEAAADHTVSAGARAGVVASGAASATAEVVVCPKEGTGGC